jgi:hypothetical protein
MTMTKIKFGIISIIAVAGVATLLAIQHQSRTRLSPEGEARSVCINNLRHIDGAIQQYALDNKLGVDDTVTAQQVLSMLNDANVMRCPLGGTYTFGRVGDRPSCSMPGHVLPRN